MTDVAAAAGVQYCRCSLVVTAATVVLVAISVCVLRAFVLVCFYEGLYIGFNEFCNT